MITIWHVISKALLPLLLLLVLAGCSGQAGTEKATVLAEDIGSRYGLEILIEEEAASLEPWDYSLVPETDPEVLTERLRLLDRQLNSYPKGMLSLLSEDCGGLKIALVKEINGKDRTEGLDSAKGLQFRDEEKGCCLILAKDQEHTLYHELCHVIEDFVVLRTPLWDQWESLNPEGFSYDLNLERNTHRHGTSYLQEQNRAFVDIYSMSFPREDRARIMEYAMTPGNEELFSSPIMQKKLSLLSQGIREAFGLHDSGRTLLWEQYLKK